MALRKEGIGVVLDSELPHLIGIDDDLLSTGIILYHLKVNTYLYFRSLYMPFDFVQWTNCNINFLSKYTAHYISPLLLEKLIVFLCYVRKPLTRLQLVQLKHLLIYLFRLILRVNWLTRDGCLIFVHVYVVCHSSC